MYNGYAIALAWPETPCKQADAWYDGLMSLIGFNQDGYYKVGHAALVLVSDATGNCSYFDFGRYHAPKGYGRVRSYLTDHDLSITTKATIRKTKGIINLDEILSELEANPSTHGQGPIQAAITRIELESALAKISELQSAPFIKYGPFVYGGTNCSRFVATAIRAGNPSKSVSLALQFPLTLTPSPVWNLRALGSGIKSLKQNEKSRSRIFFKRQLTTQ